jgi:hypothetical protein
MRKYLLAAVAAAAITSPAMARDGAGYVGVDLGALLVEDIKIDVDQCCRHAFTTMPSAITSMATTSA